VLKTAGVWILFLALACAGSGNMLSLMLTSSQRGCCPSIVCCSRTACAARSGHDTLPESCGMAVHSQHSRRTVACTCSVSENPFSRTRANRDDSFDLPQQPFLPQPIWSLGGSTLVFSSSLIGYGSPLEQPPEALS